MLYRPQKLCFWNIASVYRTFSFTHHIFHLVQQRIILSVDAPWWNYESPSMYLRQMTCTLGDPLCFSLTRAAEWGSVKGSSDPHFLHISARGGMWSASCSDHFNSGVSTPSSHWLGGQGWSECSGGGKFLHLWVSHFNHQAHSQSLYWVISPCVCVYKSKK